MPITTVAASDLQVERLAGGLESCSVLLVTGRGHRFVVKSVAGRAARESAVYRRLERTLPSLAPRLLSLEDAGMGTCTLYLEALSNPSHWPWSDLRIARRVLERAARLHTTIQANEVVDLDGWDYETELMESGRAVVDMLGRHPPNGPLARLRTHLPALRRIVGALRRWRARLLACRSLGECLIHGDLHTANVLFRPQNGDAIPVLIDWGRARAGSPLEDVSSWLQSLGYWEPAVRQRHDTLLGAYLSARGLGPTIPEDVRTAYWLAGASNALAGALEHHVTIAASTTDVEEREKALAAAGDWLRIIRRADARWTTRRRQQEIADHRTERRSCLPHANSLP